MTPLALLVAAALQGSPDYGSDAFAPITVSVETIDGAEWWSVRAQNANLERVLTDIARKSGRHVEGVPPPERSALVTVSLVRRPLEQVLEYMLGSVGLRADVRRDALTVLPDVSASDDRDDLLDHAAAAWLRATTRYPDHALAPSARIAMGEIAEHRGNLGTARDYYLSVIDRYPLSSSVPEAYMRSGRILKRMGQWAEASVQFRELTARTDASAYQPAAVLELARCTIELGNPESARYVLNTLDTKFPTTDRTERTERMLVRAEALNALDRHMEALRALDQADLDLDPLAMRQSLRIRAMALEGIGLPAESGRAWLLYSREADDSERGHALQEAARLSLVADDEIGAIFVCREAESLGLQDGLQEYWREARRRLGFDVDEVQENGGVAEQLSTAEHHLASERFEEAAELLEPLYLGRAALSEHDAARALVGWAACVEARTGLEEALRLLREARSTFESVEERNRIDVGAARLLERNAMFDRAIEAYRGSY